MSDWTNEAVWIGGNNLLRTDFALKTPAKSAALRIAGLGYFELYVNGSKSAIRYWRRFKQITTAGYFILLSM